MRLGIVGQRGRAFGRRTGPVGGEPARLDERDMHAELGHLLGQRLRKALQRPLRRVVDAHVGERGDPADRGHLQDVSASLGTQIGQRGLGDPQRPEHVGLDLGPGLVLGEFLDETELPVPGVVDHDVQAPEVIVGGLDRGEVGVAVGDVELDGQQRVAVFGGETVECGDVARGGGHLVAAFERRDRPFAAEAARCSRDEPDFSTHVRLQCAFGAVAFPVCEVHR